MRIQVRRKRYKLAFKSIRSQKYLGRCDSPHEPSKQIVIDQSLRGELLLDTLVHELLHAACWDLAEETVEEAASDIASVLWRLGYRGPTDGTV
jgi:hypothetical protein